MSRRKKILLEIKRTLEGVDGVEFVGLNPISLTDIDTFPIECIFVFSYREDREFDGNDYELSQWEIEVLGFTDGDPEELLEKISAAMYKDRQLNGLCLNLYRKYSEIFLYPEKSLAGVSSIFEIRYGGYGGET